MQNEKKRKFREEAVGMDKKHKAEERDYRERVGKEREDKRMEGMFWGAMRLLEELEQPDGRDKVPEKKVNLLWRALVRKRREKNRERSLRYDLHQSASRSGAHEDSEENELDRQVLSKEVEDVEDSDNELSDFLGLEGKDRVAILVTYLRQKHLYCFWCKFKYKDENMEGCPGLEEDSHG